MCFWCFRHYFRIPWLKLCLEWYIFCLNWLYINFWIFICIVVDTTQTTHETMQCKNNAPSLITMSSNSDSNWRTHLGYLHDKTDFLTPSQLKRYNGINSKQKRISREEKLDLDEKIVDAIKEDCRTFNDFA